MTLLNLLYLLACAPIPIEASYEEQGCIDWDPNLQHESELNIVRDGSDLLVYRNYVIQYCDGEFVPQVDPDTYKVLIREFWNSEDSSCETCLAPTVRIKNYEGQFLEFWWYIGDNDISFNIIDTDQLDDE